MSQAVYDVDTVGFNEDTLGNFYDFYVNNTFYLLAPEYYYQFYSIYLNRCLSAYDGWISGFHNKKSGLVPQRMLQSIATGLNNMLFAHGIDFSGANSDYQFAIEWAKKSKFYKALKKAHKFAIAGGTSLIKINRENKQLYITAHRIDTFFVDVDPTGKVVSCKTYFDAIQNTNASGSKDHYGICEERFFDEDGKPCIMASVYKVGGSLQTEVQSRPRNISNRCKWENLPPNVRHYIKGHYPTIMLDEKQYLPFNNSLGCFLMKFTDDIPQIPNTCFGQPIGDILFTENFQYDQMKYFYKNEVDLARARALVPDTMWNQDDPMYDQRALNERFYQKVSSMSGDDDKITPIQFNLRGNDMKAVEESIYKDCSFKLNVSASSIASFLSEGSGARTATEIVSERTKTDTWLKGQIELNAPDINEMLGVIMRYYNHEPVEIILKAEEQSPFIERQKANGDSFSAGNMSPRLYVKMTYGNTLSKSEQEEEIAYLEKTKDLNRDMKVATINSWTPKE